MYVRSTFLCFEYCYQQLRAVSTKKLRRVVDRNKVLCLHNQG